MTKRGAWSWEKSWRCVCCYQGRERCSPLCCYFTVPSFSAVIARSKLDFSVVQCAGKNNRAKGVFAGGAEIYLMVVACHAWQCGVFFPSLV